MDDDSAVRIAVVDNEIEAALLEEVLAENAIPHIMRCFHDAAYDGIFQTQKGWGCVMAPEEYRAQVEGVLHDMRVAMPAEEDEG